MSGPRAAMFGLDREGKLELYVQTDEGARLLLSADQQAFLKVAFALHGTSLEPAQNISFRTDGEELNARLGWSRERLKRVGEELERLGVLEVHEV